MSADDNPETKDTKAGRVISAANHAKLTKAADGIDGHVKTMKDVLKSAAQRQNTIAGTPLYSSSDDPIPEQKQEDETEDEADMLNKLRSSIDDLAATLQFSNADKGI